MAQVRCIPRDNESELANDSDSNVISSIAAPTWSSEPSTLEVNCLYAVESQTEVWKEIPSMVAITV